MPPVGKIAQLPEDIRAMLERAIVDHAFGDIIAVTERLNSWCEERGLAVRVGKSAVGKESARIKRAQESIAAMTRQMQLIADTAPDDADKRGEAVNAMVSVGLFDALLYAREAEAEEDPGKRIALMNKAALASARLTTTSVRQRRFRHEVESRAKTAADQVAKLAKKGGMDARTVAEIRASILGIVKREPSASA